MEEQNFSNIYVRYNLVDGKLLDNYSISNGIIIGSDFHGGKGLEKLLDTASNNGLTAVINGDVVNDYSFMELANHMGFKSQSELVFDYLNTKLSQKDLETYYFMQDFEKAGYDLKPFLSNIDETQHENFKKEVENVLFYSNSDDFKNKINTTLENFLTENKDKLQENSLKSRLLYEVFMDVEAQNVANQLNQYSNTKVLFNKGNHENTLFVEQVRNYLDNKEQIVDLGEFEGLYKIKQENGKEISLASMTNSIQSMPYLNEIIAPNEQEFLYSHMSIDEIKSKTILEGNKKLADVNNLENLIKQDNDYKRIFNSSDDATNQDEKIDIFLTHGQVGKPVFEDGRKGYDVPYHGIAAYLSNKAQLTIEGHIHSYYDGENSFGNKMLRPAGRYGAIIKKDDNGNLIKEKIDLDSNYTSGHTNPIPYNLDKMKEVVENMYINMISENKKSA